MLWSAGAGTKEGLHQPFTYALFIGTATMAKS